MIMVVPTLLYGCEDWTSLTEHEKGIEMAEMKFLRSIAEL
jgi:hypothetical protein